MKQNQPLSVSIKDKQLVVRIGIDVLKTAFEHATFNNPWDDCLLDYRKLGHVSDAQKFAEEFRNALRHEEEDGSTFLTEALDRAMEYAFKQGAEGIEDNPESNS